MKKSSKKVDRLFVYQVRSGLGDDAAEMLTRLTHQVWRILDHQRGSLRLDPHLGPEIYKTFCDAFKSRLSFTPHCGQFDYCVDIPCVLCGQGVHTHDTKKNVYLLETRQSLPHFLKALAGALTRRLRLRGVRAQQEGDSLKQILELGIVKALQENFFMSELCKVCPAREALSDRRIWARESLEIPWGGWRDVFPEEMSVPSVFSEAPT